MLVATFVRRVSTLVWVLMTLGGGRLLTFVVTVSVRRPVVVLTIDVDDGGGGGCGTGTGATPVVDDVFDCLTKEVVRTPPVPMPC
uniref:Putative secreted protein n=1 Tax=Anopheles darlingi TaxID=43151 RepID=A0A2M4DRG0_ANODA